MNQDVPCAKSAQFRATHPNGDRDDGSWIGRAVTNILRITREPLSIVVMVLVFAGVVCWSAGQWFAANVAEPMIRKHIEFLDQQMSTTEDLISVQKDILRTQDRIESHSFDTARGIEKLLEAVKDRNSGM